MRADQLLAGLNDEQVAAVTAPAGPVLICAGAGTGKTRTLATRIGYRVGRGELMPSTVLAVTHSNRAAGHLRAALRSLPVADLEHVTTRTVHAAAYRQLVFASTTLGVGAVPTLCGDVTGVVRQAARRQQLRGNRSDLIRLQHEISWAKSSLVNAEQYVTAAGEHRRSSRYPADVVAQLLLDYEEVLRDTNEVDVTDLLLLANSQLQQHPELAQVYARHLRALVVDEYQDTDPAQAALLHTWAHLGARDGGPDITVVGDPRQSIYAFKGAQPTLMGQFPEQYPHTTQVQLVHNYRNNPQITAAANQLARHLPASDTTPALLPTAPDGHGPHVRMLPTSQEEHQWVTGQVRNLLRRGSEPGDIAVLVRTNTQVAAVRTLLHRHNIPTRLPADPTFFNRDEIVALRVQLRQEIDQGADLSGPSMLREVHLRSQFDRNHPPAGDGARDIWQARRALVSWVESWPAAELLGARYLLRELDHAAGEGHDCPQNAVYVGTVHSAKGLEFHTVFSTGWDDTWTLDHQGGNQAYVAVTRAAQQLALTWARTSDNGTVRGPSPLLVAAGLTERPATHPSSP